MQRQTLRPFAPPARGRSLPLGQVARSMGFAGLRLARWLSGVALAPAVFLIALFVGGAACEVKVPLTHVNPVFAIADVSWFEAEQTMFIFYRVDAEQGIGDETRFELAYRTDDVVQEFQTLSAFEPVHTHVTVSCGIKSRCGSTSIRVRQPPREVQLRMRYHKDGDLTLAAPVVLNHIAAGSAHENRSLVVYGVFDASNTRVQWRARHQFPTLRNHEVTDLGLRRRFTITDPAHGALLEVDEAVASGNPYAYGFARACPAALDPLAWEPAETLRRAMDAPEETPLVASTSPLVCAQATVEDATGTFTTAAVARKNPEVIAPFPLLRSPITENRPLRYLMKLCERAISELHEEVQIQRLQLEDAALLCVDNFAAPGFADALAARLRADFDEARTAGEDMVLTIALHHDDRSGQLQGALEEALAQVLFLENDKSSPRVSGAFIYDSVGYAPQAPGLGRLVLWCPSDLGADLDGINAAAARSCALQPDSPDFKLGPFRLGQLPVLPTRAQLLTFVDRYSERQIGEVESLTFRAPVRAATSENVPLPGFGVATFFNNEIVTADADDAFSVCSPEDAFETPPVVFRSALSPAPVALGLLPFFHDEVGATQYDLGLAWDYPFLARMRYRAVSAVAATSQGITIPFGIEREETPFFGLEQWEKGTFPLDEFFAQCTRFCDHPTFDTAGAYQPSQPFRGTYQNTCYRPKFPQPGDGGFPLDP